MSVSSKTGLIPIQNRNLKSLTTKKTKDANKLIISTNVSKPVVFSIRPFGELYNPYSKCCSVLCNHPAPPTVRNVIKQAKNSWSLDGRNQNILENGGYINSKLDAADQIPEELFRRYTDTDSRPLTPTPTTASIRTRNSGGSFLNSRRCVTPEPGKENMNKRKKIILDLRRSHSQETVYWKAPSDISHGITADTISHMASNEDNESNREKKSLSQPKKKPEDQLVEDDKVVVCVNERGIQEEENVQRRGKKRKKSKQQQATTIFHLSQDPETQVSALGPDSLNASTRPSLIPNFTVPLLVSGSKSESIPTLLKDSYLSSEAFHILKTDLDIDIFENTFDRYLNRAFAEAMKYLPSKTNKSNTAVNLSKNIPQTQIITRKKMPRKLSKSSARFEMPLDLHILKDMSPCCYLSQFVRVSRQRKQLYKKTFIQHLSKKEITDGNEPVNVLLERKMEVSSFNKAMMDVLGFYGTEEIINRVRQAVDIDSYDEINFRLWCGLVSFAERVVVADSISSDSCDELEKSDFDSLEQRMKSLDINDGLMVLFDLIRKGHFRHNTFVINATQNEYKP